ncbi:unnamed protein product [Moneuplotes crassus]|uniref:Phosphoglycerate mutase n=1 Tax=Euplotes crassus TaxID=5936 RepID=A0AAD1XPK5_EUPCR|nr:unnamed protein product [Moneuplotes crassus]
MTKFAKVWRNVDGWRSKVVLVRHANTAFNVTYDKIIETAGFGPQILELFHDESYRDTSLSEKGIKECQYASQHAHQLDIDLVLMSPMRRTLQTAYYLLRSHPNKEKIKYIVHPSLRELLYGYSGMTRNWGHQLNKEYQYYFQNLDTSLMKNQDETYNELFFCQDVQPKLSQQFVGKSQQQIETIIMKAARANFPGNAEELECAINRSLKVKKYISDYLITRDSSLNHKKVLVVTHSLLLQTWISDWTVIERPYKEFPKDTKWAKNCEFVPDPEFD